MPYRSLALLIAALLLISASPAPQPPAAKKLIESGWDEPTPAFMRAHIAQMETAPFDGCVYRVEYKRPDGATDNFTWQGWGRRAFTREELQPAVDDLKATRFRRFTHNFLRFNVAPADLDWFDDYSAVVNNAQLAAWMAREAGSAGVWFDTEQYHGKLYDYAKQRDRGTRSWNAYAAQARQRGREVMEAFQQGYPDLVVFLTLGYSFPWRASGRGRRALDDNTYGLLVPFLDGMVEAARGKTRLVDGHELSYPNREPWQFSAAYREMRDEVKPIVADRSRYRKVFSFAFGIWMDYDWKNNGWNVAETQRNYSPPGTFEVAVRTALQTTDEYVWIYTETPRWWTDKGEPEKLPPAYTSALIKARRAVNR